MNYTFKYDERLGIRLPELKIEWEQLQLDERERIIMEWEMIRGSIPDRVKELEAVINEKQAMLNVEEDFKVSCQINMDIAELASRINDLHLWYRTHQDVEYKRHT